MQVATIVEYIVMLLLIIAVVISSIITIPNSHL